MMTDEEKQKLEILTLFARISAEVYFRSRRYYKAKACFKDNKDQRVKDAMKASKTMEKRQENGINFIREKYPDVLAGIDVKI